MRIVAVGLGSYLSHNCSVAAAGWGSATACIRGKLNRKTIKRTWVPPELRLLAHMHTQRSSPATTVYLTCTMNKKMQARPQFDCWPCLLLPLNLCESLACSGVLANNAGHLQDSKIAADNGGVREAEAQESCCTQCAWIRYGGSKGHCVNGKKLGELMAASSPWGTML